MKSLKISNFTFFHNVFYAICILKSFNSHISFVVCSFFEFGTVSKWCRREWVKSLPHINLFDWSKFKQIQSIYRQQNIGWMVWFLWGRIKKKGGYQLFLFPPPPPFFVGGGGLLKKKKKKRATLLKLGVMHWKINSNYSLTLYPKKNFRLI